LDDLCAKTPDDLQLLYRVDGSRDITEHVLKHLNGYRNSAPVRIGNAAASQVQLDIYGEIVWRSTGALRAPDNMTVVR